MARTHSARLGIPDLHEAVSRRPYAVLDDLMYLPEVAIQLDPLVPIHAADAHGHTAVDRMSPVPSDHQRVTH